MKSDLFRVARATETEMVAKAGAEEGNGELLFTGYRVSVLQDNSSGDGCEDDCTTQKALNLHFKVANIITGILPQIKKCI